MVQAGGKELYNFRPVVFVTIVEGEFDTKLIRQRGTINDLDLDAGEFKLCLIEAEVQPISDEEDDLPDCVLVDTSTVPASIFDDFADPAELEDYEVGNIVTVVGRFRFETDSVEAFASDDTPDYRLLVLIAEVIWRGDDITQSDNIACSDVTDDNDRGTWYENFELPLPEDAECADVESRPTILQPGARIYDSEGKQLPILSITEGVMNQVDGYNDTGKTPEELKAVLVMLGIDDEQEDRAQLSGTIGDLSPGESFILMTDDGDRCVNFNEERTEVFETSQDQDGNIIFNQETVSALMSGQTANAFGEESGEGCLEADTIIYEEEATVQPI